MGARQMKLDFLGDISPIKGGGRPPFDKKNTHHALENLFLFKPFFFIVTPVWVQHVKKIYKKKRQRKSFKKFGDFSVVDFSWDKWASLLLSPKGVEGGEGCNAQVNNRVFFWRPP